MDRQRCSAIIRENNQAVKGFAYLITTVISLMVLFLMEKDTVQNVGTKLSDMQGKLRAIGKSASASCDRLTDDLTIISANVILPSEQEQQNLHWIDTFAKLKNPRVIYFTDKQELSEFDKIAPKDANYPAQLNMLDINTTWSFELLPHIQKTLLAANHSKHDQTLETAQSMTKSFLKYELIYKTVIKNPFCTNYFAWIDSNIFKEHKDRLQEIKDFQMYIPKELEPSRVAFYQSHFKENISSNSIILGNKEWICEDVIVGYYSHIKNLAMNFMTSAVKYLDTGLVGFSKNIIYAMYANPMDPKATKLQVYEQEREACSSLGLILLEGAISHSNNNES